MAVITISATSLGAELVAGIPQLVSLETNIPATIFYTLDGTLPNISSSVYTQPILFPTNAGIVRLRALAISGSDSGIFDAIYSNPKVKEAHQLWRFEGYSPGIVFDAYNVADVPIDSYTLDSNNQAVVSVLADAYLDQFDFKTSDAGEFGLGLGTEISFTFSPDHYKSPVSLSHEASSPNNNNAFFNPKSLYIVIDGRDSYADQIVYPINRPIGSMRDSTRFSNGKDYFNKGLYVSGGLVKTYYNPSKKLMVSYYFDSAELRWVKSIQHYDIENVPPVPTRKGSPPFVFRWITNKRSTI